MSRTVAIAAALAFAALGGVGIAYWAELLTRPEAKSVVVSPDLTALPPDGPEPHRLHAPITAAMGKSVGYLLAARSPDGLWRSESQPEFRDGNFLSARIAVVLYDTDGTTESIAARRAVANHFARMARPDGSVDFQGDIAVAGLALRLLCFRENAHHAAARLAWLRFLLDKQLGVGTTAPSDHPLQGGWQSGLDATVLVLDGLRSAAALLEEDDPLHKRLKKCGIAAWQFVTRQQNFTANPLDLDPKYDDGGFAQPLTTAGTDTNDRTRYRSAGAATADGMRALRAAWVLTGNSRFGYAEYEDSARAWLMKKFTPESQPGKFAASDEPQRAAGYFRYAASVAKAFRQGNVREIEDAHWSESLATAVLAKQSPEGAWCHLSPGYRESEPLWATTLAVESLAECRGNLPRPRPANWDEFRRDPTETLIYPELPLEGE